MQPQLLNKVQIDLNKIKIQVRVLEASSLDALLIYLNGTILHFTRRKFTLITGLNCVASESEFDFGIEQPN
ncbi:hypothetical protein HAX54_047248, partial [Datura stramonium]|nr:hypothetical protein [Datura stramonium]